MSGQGRGLPAELVVTEAGRLDLALARLVPGASRAQLQKHILAGAVTVNGAPPARGAKTPVSPGDRLAYSPPAPPPVTLEAEDVPLDILFEDAHYLVIDKPAGLVVHPGPGHARGTLVHAVLGYLAATTGFADDARPGIVHRLDRDTTGVIAVAKHPRAHEALAAAFQARTVQKRYVAVVAGVPRPAKGTIDTFYGRHPRHRQRFSSRVPSGKRAVSHYAVDAVYVGAARLSVRIETGRTHQIRVHLADRGHPILGDATYGRRVAILDPRTGQTLLALSRPQLHAASLAFVHPLTGEAVAFEAPIPADMLETMSILSRIEPAG